MGLHYTDSVQPGSGVGEIFDVSAASEAWGPPSRTKMDDTHLQHHQSFAHHRHNPRGDLSKHSRPSFMGCRRQGDQPDRLRCLRRLDRRYHSGRGHHRPCDPSMAIRGPSNATDDKIGTDRRFLPRWHVSSTRPQLETCTTDMNMSTASPSLASLG